MVSTVLHFKSGNSRKVDWIEERLVKKVKNETSEVTEPLDLKEANAFFVAKFKEWKDNGSTIVRKNVKGDNSVIPFSEVEYATLQVTEYDVEPAKEQPKVERSHQPINDITQHPAYKPPMHSNKLDN